LTRAKCHGLWVTTWSPGDGVTRYRFHAKPGDYNDGSDIGFALGLKEANAWIDGWIAAKEFAANASREATE
jgi:hypothetical protein